MAKNDTSITSESRKNMPSRGRNKRTLILESLRERAFKGLSKSATLEEAEKAWFGFLADSAIDSEDKNSGICLKLLTERGWSALKPSSELVTFDFDPTATPAEKAEQILKAVSDGVLPMDYGERFIVAINSMTNIEANTELKAEIERIKEKLGLE